MACCLRKKILQTARGLLIMALAAMAFTIVTSVNGCYEKTDSKGQGFNSPQAAVSAIVATVRAHDAAKALAILGPDAKEIIFSGDVIKGKEEVVAFVAKYDEKYRIDMVSPTRADLIIGNDEWPFPIPVVKRGTNWFFDVAAGREELLNRRIGDNELNVIQVMQAYVVAQLEYAGKDRDGDGVREFARQIKSDEGKRNGLYWPATMGKKLSPFGSLIAEASSKGVDIDSDKDQPYHGYYYKILTRQGKNAPGGEYDYVVNGNMILGFGLVAYPAKYGVSGIMTFVVNQDGAVYEVDLGEETTQIVTKQIDYDLNKIWKKVVDLDLD